MNLTSFLDWALERARERSTWMGLAMLAGAVGAQALSLQIGVIGNAVLLILGTGAVAASTRP